MPDCGDASTAYASAEAQHARLASTGVLMAALDAAFPRLIAALIDGVVQEAPGSTLLLGGAVRSSSSPRRRWSLVHLLRGRVATVWR